MALFGSGAPDHPMAGIRQAKKLISELPAYDSIKALDEVTFWLDSIGRTEGFRVDHRFELIDLLDHAARGHQRKLAQDYLATDRQEKFRENRLWNTLFNFWKHLGDAYGQCVEQFQSGASGGAGAIRRKLPTIVARALRALTVQLKWSLLRYGPVDVRLWGEAGQLYLFAEAKRIATETIEIYPDANGQGTVQQEFLKSMMLGVSSTGGLTPLRQEIAERAVAYFGGMFTLQARPTPGCNDYFDLSMHTPPARVMKGLEPNEMTRFFGAGKALPALERLIEEIKATDTVPSHVNLGGMYDSGLVLSVLQQLATYWSGKPPARSSGRRKIATRLTVVHGFREVLRAVEPAADEALDLEQATGTESWIVENVSEGGFGAVIPQVKGDWIKVGTILAVQTEASQFWAAAIIRRITRDEYQLRHVGIQLLAQAVIPIRLALAGSASPANAMREGEPGVLLSPTPDRHGEIALLLRGGSYTPGQGLEMNVRGKRYHLAPRKLVEGGDDFDWAKFKVMRRA
ncbi:MAG: hypothetical protein HYS65_07340 [Betaproteobacteria bacterium]|nr:hypothetical protein [Betaproteobacteria bacterium]